MALKHDYTILCEMARMELGGKFIIVGLFPNGIGTPAIPFPLPMLTFFNALRADGPGTFKFTGKLSQLVSGEVLAQVQGIMQAGTAGPLIMPITFPNLQFKAFGSYTWALEVEGQGDPFVTEFQVQHVPIQMRVPPGFPPPPGFPR